MANDDYDLRVESEAKLGFHVTNGMLDCADCMFKIVGKSGVCEVFEDVKPMEVLNGGECVVKQVEG